MKRSSTFTLGRAALAACLYAAAAFYAYPGAPPEQTDRPTDAAARAITAGESSAAGRSGAARQVSGRTLMTPEEHAVLKEQVRRASAPADAGSGSGRSR